MTHPDCGENCVCSRRAYAVAAREIWKMPIAAASKRFKTWANGGEPPKPKEKAPPKEKKRGTDAMDELDTLGIPRGAVESVEPVDGQRGF